MELKRLGLARKPMFAVPNHMLGQFSSELLMLYPGANILVAGKEDFEAQNRKKLFSRIATGNWDAVIVTHSGFERIPMSQETQERFFKEQLDELEKIKREHANPDNRRLVKELEKAKKRLEAKLEALAAEDKKDNTLTFEELGMDRLFVDEAHYFKNLFYISKMTRIAGLPQTASRTRLRYVFESSAHPEGQRRRRGRLCHRHAHRQQHGRNVHHAALSAAGRFEETESASFRFLGGDVRRAGDGDGACAGRRGLPAQHALCPVHQCAGTDADFLADGGHADRADAQTAASETGRGKAGHPQCAGHAGIEKVCGGAGQARRGVETRAG